MKTRHYHSRRHDRLGHFTLYVFSAGARLHEGPHPERVDHAREVVAEHHDAHFTRRAIASSTANISGYRCVLIALSLGRLEEQFRQVALVASGFQAFILNADLGVVILEA